MSTFNQGVPAVPTLINSSATILTANAVSSNALTVRQFGTGNVFSAQTTTGSTALFVGANGNIGIGTTNPQTTVNGVTMSGILTIGAAQVQSGGDFYGNYLMLTRATGNNYASMFGHKYLATASNSGLDFHVTDNADVSTSAPKMTIRSSGNVGIGTDNPSTYKLQVSGTIGATGDITAYFSDDRLKTKTGLIESALEKVLSLEAFTYVPNDLAKSFGFEDSKQRVGLSAQSVQRVLPEAVCPAPFDADNASGQQYLTVQYDKLVPLLVEAIKELAGRGL